MREQARLVGARRQRPQQRLAGSDPASVRAFERRAVRLEWLTIAWCVVEGALAVGAGIVARSLALTSFGLDSFIELFAAVLVLLRLRATISTDEVDEARERWALKAIAVTFFLLAAYVLLEAVRNLINRAEPERAPVGIALTVAGVVVMPLLSWRKRVVAEGLHGTLQELVAADAAETVICGALAFTTLLGLVLFALFGWWWADPLAALMVVVFAVREGREAWEGELVCAQAAQEAA